MLINYGGYKYKLKSSAYHGSKDNGSYVNLQRVIIETGYFLKMH